MFTINVTIEKGADLFSAWAENIPGIYGEGESVKEVKEDILKAIAYLKSIMMRRTFLKNSKVTITLNGTLMYSHFYSITAESYQSRFRENYRYQSKTIRTLCFWFEKTA